MKYFAYLLILVTCLSGPAHAGSSFDHSSDMLTARLITAEDGVAPGASTLSAGLVIDLKDGWKTYWKSPGQVGYPPTVNWEGSDNVENVEFQWPVPKRFVAFDIENYGYETSVTHPLKITLSAPGEPANLRGSVSLLVCSDICVPQEFDLALSVPQGTDIDLTSAELIAKAAAKVPVQGNTNGLELISAVLTPARDQLTVSVKGDGPLKNPQVFIDMGLATAFGPPKITQTGPTAAITLPILSIPEQTPAAEITVVDGPQAAAFSPKLTVGASTDTSNTFLWTLLLAFIGGLILNVMPCVLPVLSIKFASALKSADQSLPRIRTGFLVSAMGVLAFMWALAAILITLRATGGQVGWGIQFQSPIFLSLMVLIMAFFAANLAGLFEITLPQNWTTGLAKSGDRSGLAGDFATGALAAVMATPCSAPFLGTAVTVALAGSNLDTIAIFTALGTGLALPYLLVALRPQFIQKLPRPGAWMNTVKLVLALMMAATCLWLLSVLASVIGTMGAALVFAAGIVAILGMCYAGSSPLRLASLAAPVFAILLAPQFSPTPLAPKDDAIWVTYSQENVVSAVAEGQVVFVDVTAAWCLTCKANKSLILDRGEVAERLTSKGVTAMQADWTRPDAAILAFLQAHGRYGIPFNIVYGPNAPDGIALPEILTKDAVLSALDQAAG